MLASIPLRLYYEWIEYSALEPFGEELADWRAAMLACVMANAWRGKRSRRFRIQDFMPKRAHVSRPRQTPEQMKAILRAAARAHNEYIRTRQRHA